MNPPKITVHHLDSPAMWEQDENERLLGRRRKLHILSTLVGAGLLTATLHRGNTVEDYSHHSRAALNITVQPAEESPETAANSLLADLSRP